jgi:DNA-binding NtrC family response regulator
MGIAKQPRWAAPAFLLLSGLLYSMTYSRPRVLSNSRLEVMEVMFHYEWKSVSLARGVTMPTSEEELRNSARQKFGIRRARLREEEFVISSRQELLKERSASIAPAESHVADAIRRIAASECPVLVTGEPGVGKSSASELLHALSPRSAGVCQSLPARDAHLEKISSQFHGSGTLVLVEVCELPWDTQRYILAQYGQGPAGGRNRLICTTRHDLAEGVRAGHIGEDFGYFISTVSLRLPPLRHRRGELLNLAEDMLERYARQYDRPKPLLNSQLCDFLLDHTWPGNLTELEVSMKTCVAIGDPDFSLAALKAAMPKRLAATGNIGQTSLKSATRAACNRVERELIAEVLRATDGNRKQTAKELKISYKTLLYKLKQTGLSGTYVASPDGASL